MPNRAPSFVAYLSRYALYSSSVSTLIGTSVGIALSSTLVYCVYADAPAATPSATPNRIAHVGTTALSFAIASVAIAVDFAFDAIGNNPNPGIAARPISLRTLPPSTAFSTL